MWASYYTQIIMGYNEKIDDRQRCEIDKKKLIKSYWRSPESMNKEAKIKNKTNKTAHFLVPGTRYRQVMIANSITCSFFIKTK